MFKPWIGRQFGEPNNKVSGCRVLILGESHYAGDGDEIGGVDPEFTNFAVQKYAIEDGYPTFSNLMRSFDETCNSHDYKERREFWDSVAFYNYVPVFVSGETRRPLVWMFEAGDESFQKVLADVQPSAVLVLSKRLWEWVAWRFSQQADDHWAYSFINNSEQTYGRVGHPSRAFNQKKWAPYISKLLAFGLDNQNRQVCEREAFVRALDSEL